MDIATPLWTFGVCTLLAILIKWLLGRWKNRLPPGPFGIPLLGYAPFLSNSPYKDYLRLKDKYGDVFGYYHGTQYTVILSRYSDIKEAFNKEEFLDRPKDWFQISKDFTSLVEVNGWEWKEMRKFTVSALRNLGIGKNKVENTIMEEIHKLKVVLERAGPDAEINVFDVTYLPLLNMVLTISCGESFQDGDHLVKMMERFNKEVVPIITYNHNSTYYPYLRPFFWLWNILHSERFTSGNEMNNFVKKEIERHEKEYDENHLEDFMAYYIREMKKIGPKKTSLTMASLNGNIQGLLFAGTDTTRITLSWIILNLAFYQREQDKIYNEIVEVLGREKPPSWSDLESLPHTYAFILESSRFKTVVPAADPHWSNNEGNVRGFHIPQNTLVLANLEAVHKDSRLWGDPEIFRPDRFVSTDGKKATAPEYWIPFLTGKRVCPGARLAKMQLFLITASLVQRFHIVGPVSGLSLEDQDDVFIFPVKPIVSFKPRE